MEDQDLRLFSSKSIVALELDYVPFPWKIK